MFLLFLSDAEREAADPAAHDIESTLDVGAAAGSGALIAATVALMLAMGRFAGIIRRLR